MNRRALTMLGLALVLAVLSVAFARQWMDGARKSAKPAAEKPARVVIVAKDALTFGAVLRADDLKAMAWPDQPLPEGAFTSIGDLVHKGEHRYVLRRIEANEPILGDKVSEFGGRASLSAIIEADMRAATIRVNDVHGVAGFVLPGDRVDVLITRSRQGDAAASGHGVRSLVADVLLQNVKVLGIDQQADERKDKPMVAKAVTLEVTPSQAQKLVLAQQIGTLSLALRNAQNAGETRTRTIGLHDLGFGEANDVRGGPEKDLRRPAAAPSITVFRGMRQSEHSVIHESASPGASRKAPRTQRKASKASEGPAYGRRPELFGIAAQEAKIPQDDQ